MAAVEKNRPGVRGRLHWIWVLAHLGGPTVLDDLMRLAEADPEPSVRAQAVRAVADLTDPLWTKDASLHRRVSESLAALSKDQPPQVRLEVLIALGRLRWAGLPDWLRRNPGQPDPPLAHAAMQALRRSENWSAILKLLDEPGGTPLRTIALRAIAGRFEPKVVDGLLERLRSEKNPARRREYADALTRVCKKPGPWVYWGYRPAAPAGELSGMGANGSDRTGP